MEVHMPRRQGKNLSRQSLPASDKLRKAERFVAEKKGEPAVPVSSVETMSPSLWADTGAKKEPAVIVPLRAGGRIDIIALGISTGGPNALRTVFKLIDPHIRQPILVVQHMPAGFTKEFANSLDPNLSARCKGSGRWRSYTKR